METLDKEQTGLIKVEEITSTMTNAGEVLIKNENLVNKAVNGGQMLIDTAASGMSDELDTKMNEWQVKAKDALKIMNERRSSVTQLMTKIAKSFTSQEAKIDPAKADSTFAKIQALRNSYAREKAEKKRIAEAEIIRKQNIENEKVEVSAIIEQQIRSTFNSKIFEFKAFYTKVFNEATLENFVEAGQKIENAKLSYPMDKFMELPVNVTASYLTKEELNAIILQKRTDLYHVLNADFHESIESLKTELKDKLPSKKTELENIAKADEAEKERLEEAKKQREALEAKQALADQEKAQADAQAKIDAEKEMGKVNNLFNAQTSISAIAEDEKPVRESYSIDVLNKAGWMQIVSFWFENEANTLDLDKFEKKTLLQMKTFAEKSALKDDKKKIVSNHLVYREEFKAVVKK